MIPPDCKPYLTGTFVNPENVKVVASSSVSDTRGANTRKQFRALSFDTKLREMETNTYTHAIGAHRKH